MLEKIKSYDLGGISANEVIEKLKKETKLLEERYNNSELQIKNKSAEIAQFNQAK